MLGLIMPFLPFHCYLYSMEKTVASDIYWYSVSRVDFFHKRHLIANY